MCNEMFIQKCGENDYRLFDDIDRPAISYDYESFDALFTYAENNGIGVAIPEGPNKLQGYEMRYLQFKALQESD